MISVRVFINLFDYNPLSLQQVLLPETTFNEESIESGEFSISISKNIVLVSQVNSRLCTHYL